MLNIVFFPGVFLILETKKFDLDLSLTVVTVQDAKLL